MKRESQVFGQILSTKDWSKLTKIVPKSTVLVQSAATQWYIRQLLVSTLTFYNCNNNNNNNNNNIIIIIIIIVKGKRNKITLKLL